MSVGESNQSLRSAEDGSCAPEASGSRRAHGGQHLHSPPDKIVVSAHEPEDGDQSGASRVATRAFTCLWPDSDEALEDSANLPGPDVIAAGIVPIRSQLFDISESKKRPLMRYCRVGTADGELLWSP